MPTPFPAKGLYVITPDSLHGDALYRGVEQAVIGGAAAVQYRPKSGSWNDRLTDGRHLLEVCRAAGLPLIVNDSPRLAADVGADGVHLGKDDCSVAEARSLLGDGAIIGVSCYDSLERAIRAEAEGADYVAFGAFFPSTTKPSAPPARLQTLRDAKARLRIPAVAIGGIDAGNAAAVIAAGADLIAVIGAVFGAPNATHAALALRRLFAH